MRPITSPMSTGRVLQTTLVVFVENLPRLLLGGLLPFFPGVAVLGALIYLRHGVPSASATFVVLFWLSDVLLALGVLVSYVMTMRIAADACEKKSKPLIVALRYGVDRTVVKSLVTWVVLGGGLALVLAPALWVSGQGLDPGVNVAVWALCWMLVLGLAPLLMFAPAVVVVEERWTVAAVRRSVELAWGRSLRNCVVLSVGMVLLAGGAAVLSVVLGWIPTSALPEEWQWLVTAAGTVTAGAAGGLPGGLAGWLSLPLVWLIAAPIYPVLILVLYYDMRVRNGESFAPLPTATRFPDPPKLQQDGKSFGALPPKSRTRVAGGKGGTRSM